MGSVPWRLLSAVLGVSALFAVVVWNAGGVAGSDPVATIGRVAAFPPAGVRLTRASVTVWSSSVPRRSPVHLAALARSALGGPGSPTAVHIGALGAVRWAGASAGPRWSVVQVTPPVPAADQPRRLVVMAGERLALPASLGPAASSLARTVRAYGPPQVAVCASGIASAGTRSPLALARLLALRMGARVVESVGGPRAAELLARLPGAPGVAVAGRPINVEVRVARARAGLVVDVASPFIAPGGCTAPGDGTQAA